MNIGPGPVIFFAIWVVCGVIAGSMAQRKGLAGCGYFLAGFLLGPLGILIAAVSTPAGRLSQLTPAPSEGWHRDPTGRFDRRYFDGRQWTRHVTRDAGEDQFEDPL